MSYQAYYEARDVILEFIRKDALGPISTDEVLQEPPLDTYVCGILWPRRTLRENAFVRSNMRADEVTDAQAMLDSGSEIEDENADVLREANQFRPSVMAISFALHEDAREISLCFDAARYENIDKPVEGKKYILHEYRRIALSTGTMRIALPGRSKRMPICDGLAVLQIVRRKRMVNDRILWTVSIENSQTASQNEIDQNRNALFQCQLTLQGNFCPIDNPSVVVGDQDRQNQAFLYKDVHSYAAGHGCSVEWDDTAAWVEKIRSTFLPKTTISQMIASTDMSFECFTMKNWNDSRRTEGTSEIIRYIENYKTWQRELRDQLPKIESVYQKTAGLLLDRISECIRRLEAAISVLQTNDTAWKAFCLMNKAMMRQSAKRRHASEDTVQWYPFQLCYVLMCLPDLVDEHSEWRDTVDLLWFPTGGGKTEAYLGVAAFTIFYRRLTKGEAGKGVAVLMRYTLRMLTSQQFERAAALICECELIRRQEAIPGGEISIGLWVGGDVTPNHVHMDRDDFETAETVLEKLRAGRIEDVRTSPAQLSYCPFCAEPLLPQTSYEIRNRQFKTHCPNDACPFHDDLPVITVDDDVYDRKPTLLIGTIDKFARLTWDTATGAIFAEDNSCLPPELLIQDELHLILGPLGSISGLYEIAIDALCTRNGVRPKVLASTATLCNASAQIRALYGRDAFQFPPSGFSANDSFFARIANKEERPQRMYLGYCETGGSLADAIVRTFGVVKFAVQYLSGKAIDPKVIDQFWTNVGYFNSLKDLGSAGTLIIDRVCAYAESLRRHKFRAEAEEVHMERISNQYEYDELTSRKSSREIAEVRDQLDKRHYPDPAAFNYVLSSNMLSVGIDINRLGLMTVYGQPKSTAEYIQATSRVGRSNPGLVVVLLHMLRTRDKSHFEQFPTYHQALNKMVEPTSVTPYACRTMDKALHSVFVILIRHQCSYLSGNCDAAKFRCADPNVIRIRDSLLKEIEARSKETAMYAKDILEEFMLAWEDAAINRGMNFQYQLLNKSENTTDALLIPAERSEGAQFPPTMNSMRNVDTQSGVFLKRR